MVGKQRKLTFAQKHQQRSESESDVEEVAPEVNTQAVIEEVATAIQHRNCPTPTPQDPAVPSENSSNMKSMQEWFTEIWEDGVTLLFILQVFSKMTKVAILERKPEWKKIIYTMQQETMKGLKDLKAKKIGLEKASLQDFMNTLVEEGLSTMFTKKNMPEDLATRLYDEYVEITKDQFSSSVITMTTTTSCTTAVSVMEPVDAQSSKTYDKEAAPATTNETQVKKRRRQRPVTPVPDSSDDSEEEEIDSDQESITTKRIKLAKKIENAKEVTSVNATLDELFPVSTSQSHTGVISQSILRNTDDTSFTWSTPGESGYRVVKMDIYDFSKISGVPKNLWWEKANLRSTFIITSPADPKEMLVNKLTALVAKDLKATPGLVKSQRATGSSNFYKNTQRRQ